MLDPFTTLFLAALTTAACGSLLLVCCERDGNAPLLPWAVAMIVAASGFVMTAAADGGLAGSIGTALLLFASALFWTATRLFRGGRERWALATAGPLLWLATAPLQTGGPAWTAVPCLIGAAYTIASVGELLRLRDESLPSWLPAVALTAAHAAIYLGRSGLAIGQAVAPGWIEAPDWIGVALLTEAMIHINGSTIVLVALSREKGERLNSRGLRLAAFQDRLTGIANRRKLDARLDALAGDPRQRSNRLGLMMIDLDRFKSVNDTVGHSEGDRILCAVARIIASNVRPETDLAARYGGEEFAVVVDDTSLDHLWIAAERIRLAVEAAAIRHPGTGGAVTISIGIGVLDTAELGNRRRELFAAADDALYRAKRLGRNRVVAAEAPGQHQDIGPPHDIRAA